MSDRKPEFEVGDLVQHRASRQRAIVIEVLQDCVTQHEPYQFICSKECEQGFCGAYTLSRGFGDTFSADELVIEAVGDRPELPPKPEPPNVERFMEGTLPKQPPPSLPNYPPLSADDCENILYQAASVVVRCAISADHLLPWIRLAGNMQDRGIWAHIAKGLLNSVLPSEGKPGRPEPPLNRDTVDGMVPPLPDF